MPLVLIFALYAFILIYGVTAYALGSFLQVVTVVLSFGLLIIFYLALEWIATPFVALAIGFQARWSFTTSLVLGAPLVVLFTVITLVVSSGNPSLPMPVPWLSVFKKARTEVIPIIHERLIWWGGIYMTGMLIGRISRFIRPIAEKNA